MIVYNVTVKIDGAIQQVWLAWLKEEHIPDIMGTGCFTHAVILQLLETDEVDGPTYAIQYHAANRERYDKYINSFSHIMKQKALDKWGDRFIAFITVMHIVS